MESLGRPESQAQGMNENKGCWEVARSMAKIVAQRLSRALPWIRTLGSLCHSQGWGLKDDQTAAATLPWNLDMAATAAATPTREASLRGTLCGLWFRIQVVLLIGQAQVTCLGPANEGGWEASVMISFSIVKGEQWTLTSTKTHKIEYSESPKSS